MQVAVEVLAAVIAVKVEEQIHVTVPTSTVLQHPLQRRKN